MRIYGVLCVVLGLAALTFRHRLATWLNELRMPGDTPSNVYWGRVVLPSILAVVVGAAMVVRG